jgi:hypothetical protein
MAMSNMFWMAAGGLVLAMVLLFGALLVVQLSARVRYIPYSIPEGDYAISGITANHFRFSGSVKTDDVHDHKGAEWAIRAWAFRRGVKVKVITHIASGKLIYERK